MRFTLGRWINAHILGTLSVGAAKLGGDFASQPREGLRRIHGQHRARHLAGKTHDLLDKMTRENGCKGLPVKFRFQGIFGL